MKRIVLLIITFSMLFTTSTAVGETDFSVRLTATIPSLVNPLAVRFTPTVTGVGDTSELIYNWSFGDGNTGTAIPVPYIEHTYHQAGTYFVSMEVFDYTGQNPKSAFATKTITLSESTAHTKTCPIIINEDLSFRILNAFYDAGPFIGKTAFKLDFTFFGEQNGQLLWQFADAGNPPSSPTCSVSIEPDFGFTLEDVVYDAGPSVGKIAFQAEFKYSGEQNGAFFWYLADIKEDCSGPWIEIKRTNNTSNKLVLRTVELARSSNEVSVRTELMSGAGCWYTVTPNYDQPGFGVGNSNVLLIPPYGRITIDENLILIPGHYYYAEISRQNTTAHVVTAIDVILRGMFSIRLEDVLNTTDGKIDLLLELIDDSGLISKFDTGTVELFRGNYIKALINYVTSLKSVADVVGHSVMEQTFFNVLGISGEWIWKNGVSTLIETLSLPTKTVLLKEIGDNYVFNPGPFEGNVKIEAIGKDEEGDCFILLPEYTGMTQNYDNGEYYIAFAITGASISSIDIINGPNILKTWDNHAYLSQRPEQGDIYTIRINIFDGTSQESSYTVGGVNDNFAIITSPEDFELIETIQPTIEWQPSLGVVSKYFIQVNKIEGAEETTIWMSGDLNPEDTSCVFNFDNKAIEPLHWDGTYKVYLYSYDENGNQAASASTFIILDSVNPPGKCGAYIAPGVWKEFDCYNLAAIGKTTGDDPFTPSWRLIGGYWQWGRKRPSSNQWHYTNTEHFAHGPTGPGQSEANEGEISGWDDDDYAPDGAWSDDYKTANDPCPAGYRVPTIAQWEGVIDNNNQSTVGTWDLDVTNYSSARFFGDDLMLPAAGGRGSGSGTLYDRGHRGSYWSSSDDGSRSARLLGFNSGSADAGYYSSRRNGFSVRCVAEDNSPSPVTLNKTQFTLESGNSENITITGGTGIYTVNTSNNQVATAVISGSSVDVTGLSTGTAIITVEDTGGATASIQVTVSSPAGIGDGLYAHFPFEQSSNDSTMNLSGFEYGNGINYEKGIVGNYAGKFDGETAILFSNDYLFPLCNGTINFFIKIDPEASYNVRIMDSKTNFRTWIGYNAENSEINGYLTVPIEKNQWYMFTFVYSNGCSSSGSRKAYLNGVLTSENVGYANNGNIGTWYASACSYYSLIGLGLASDEKMASSKKFKGLLDDIRIYNRALSINEIQELYGMAIPML